MRLNNVLRKVIDLIERIPRALTKAEFKDKLFTFDLPEEAFDRLKSHDRSLEWDHNSCDFWLQAKKMYTIDEEWEFVVTYRKENKHKTYKVDLDLCLLDDTIPLGGLKDTIEIFRDEKNWEQPKKDKDFV